jgi:hypothetical protein
MALGAFEKTQAQFPEKELRHRIEHASVLNPDLINRMAASNIIAAVQPRFIVSDSWVEQRLGARRAKLTYPFSSLLRNKVRTIGGSDCPVEPLDPILGIAAAVDRPGSDEAISVEQAIALYTREAAFGSFDEDAKGTITPGKYADFVVLGKDPRKVHPRRIHDLKVLMTIVGGRVAYQRDNRLAS